LGSYPRADGTPVEVSPRYDDEAFVDARDWLRGLISGLR
jgi:prephenate dehydratase